MSEVTQPDERARNLVAFSRKMAGLLYANSLISQAGRLLADARLAFAALATEDAHYTEHYKWAVSFDEGLTAFRARAGRDVLTGQDVLNMIMETLSAPADFAPVAGDTPGVAWVKAHIEAGHWVRVRPGSTTIEIGPPGIVVSTADTLIIRRHRAEIIAYLAALPTLASRVEAAETTYLDGAMREAIAAASADGGPILAPATSAVPVPEPEIAAALATATLKGHTLTAFCESPDTPGLWLACCEDCLEDVLVDTAGAEGAPLEDQCGTGQCQIPPPLVAEAAANILHHARSLGHVFEDDPWDMRQDGNGLWFGYVECVTCNMGIAYYPEQQWAGGDALQKPCPPAGPALSVPPVPPVPQITNEAPLPVPPHFLAKAETVAAGHGHVPTPWRRGEGDVAVSTCLLCERPLWVSGQGTPFGDAFKTVCRKAGLT